MSRPLQGPLANHVHQQSYLQQRQINLTSNVSQKYDKYANQLKRTQIVCCRTESNSGLKTQHQAELNPQLISVISVTMVTAGCSWDAASRLLQGVGAGARGQEAARCDNIQTSKQPDPAGAFVHSHLLQPNMEGLDRGQLVEPV